MTSEERYGISKQPPETCPMINAGLEDLKNMVKENAYASRNMRRADEDELRSLLEEVLDMNDRYYGDVEDAFEKARKNATAIREWGQEWKDLAKEMADKVESVQTPWDGIVLWWNELGESWWRATWVYKTCFAPLPKERNAVVL